jgi:hypothetical protein
MNTSLKNSSTIVSYHDAQLLFRSKHYRDTKFAATRCSKKYKFENKIQMVPTTDIHYAEFELDFRSMEYVKQAEALGVLPSSPVHGSRKQLSKNKTLCWTEEVHMQEKRRTGRRDPRTGKSRLPVKRRVDRNKVAPQKLARRSKTKQKLARGILRLRHSRRLVLSHGHT